MYVATVNVPGYLPMDDDPPVFDTAREAWDYLAEEAQRDGEFAWLPDDGDDPDGPASLAPWVLELERMGREDRSGSVWGPTPGYGGDHDLGLAYSVVWDDREQCSANVGGDAASGCDDWAEYHDGLCERHHAARLTDGGSAAVLLLAGLPVVALAVAFMARLAGAIAGVA